ncbi:MAG: HAMP domain-containing histidine kinase [Oscillospiraceae bacterium]|nr:HAMP domain-containing histidine kinase [Oscillospiraceae bacterium]
MKRDRKRRSGAVGEGLSERYFRLSGMLLLCGILLTGVIMVCSAVATYTDTIKTAQRQACDALIANITESYRTKADMTDGDIPQMLRLAELEYDYRLFLYDEHGTELYPGTGAETDILTPSVRNYLNTGEYMQLGYYTADAQQQQLCCVQRFLVEGRDKSVGQYYLGAVSDAGHVQSYTAMLVRHLLICLLVGTLVFMLLFRIGTRPLERDLDEIDRVTRQYAEGEFSARAALPEQSALYPLGSTLGRMADFIEQNETTRRNFVANVSHELRTPMTTIGGFADGILDGTIPPEQHRKYIGLIAEEIRRLRTLVNSMLNLTKFEAGEMELRLSNVDIAKLLIKTVLMFEKRISDKHVEVEGLEDVSLVIRADEDLMFQVLYNLIENAVKFVNEGGTISFSLRTEQKTAYIGIKNTGEGLADDELPRIFERFYKTDTSRSQDKTGLGLGLSISRKIVHLHRGHIVVGSVKGEYTSFEVQLPI